MKLAIYEQRLGKDKADKYVLSLSKKIGLPIESRHDLKREIEYSLGGKSLLICFPSEVQHVMQHGKANVLQQLMDSEDRYLNTPLSLGVLSCALGTKIEVSSGYGLHRSSITSPGLIQAPEVSFSNEITFYRKAAVDSFNAGDIEGFARCYRAFLQSSISLVECFLHRYSFHLNVLMGSTKAFDNTATLDSRKPIEDRLYAWMETFAVHRIQDFLNSKMRSKFIELKSVRNSIVHPTHPTIAYSVSEVVKYMNYAQDGIGGLLSELRRFSEQSEDIGFIRQIKTEPQIRILKAT